MNDSKDFFKDAAGGTVIHILIQPKASKNEVVGKIEELKRIKIRIAAPPVEGAANDALIDFLAKKLKRSKSTFEIIRGHTSRSKDVFCRDFDRAYLEAELLR